jgi:predicted transcriptional regulator
MNQYENLLKKLQEKYETIDVQWMINKALIGILISKGIVTEEEILIILGNINSYQDIYSMKQSKT